MRVALFTLRVAALVLMATTARAADDAEAVAGVVAEEGFARETTGLATHLRTQLQQKGVCDPADPIDCQQQLREQVRACLHTGKQEGTVQTEDGAARVALAVMQMSRNGDSTMAGKLVQKQLENQWKAAEVEEGAKQVAQQEREPWRHQTMKMLQECSADGSCDAEQARAAVAAMKQASRRADLDARRARKAIQTMLKKQLARGGTAGAKDLGRQARKGSGAGSESGLVGSQEQRQYRYRNRADSEQRRGGQYGGNASGGVGKGFDGQGAGVGHDSSQRGGGR